MSFRIDMLTSGHMRLRLDHEYILQPKSLQTIAKESIGKLIFDTLSAASCQFHTTTNYADKQYLKPVKDLQEYLLRTAGPLWHEFTEFKNIVRNSTDLKNACMIDNAIFLPFLMHSGMKICCFDLVITCKQIMQCVPFFTNLRHLDMGLNGLNDAHLCAIGRNCAALETLVFNTNHKSVTNNRLTQVSAFGLSQLNKCTKLRSITDVAKLETFKPDIIAFMVRAMKNLEHINYEYMESVLVEYMSENEPLKIQRLPLHISNPENFAVIANLCPNVSTLTLNQNAEDFQGLIAALTNTSWVLRELSLKYIFFNLEVRDLLRQKGRHIKVFNISSINALNAADVAFIGEHCRFLTKLTISCVTDSWLVPEIETLSIQETPVSVGSGPHHRPFGMLTHLKLAGYVIDNGSLFNLFAGCDQMKCVDFGDVEKSLVSVTFEAVKALAFDVANLEMEEFRLNFRHFPHFDYRKAIKMICYNWKTDGRSTIATMKLLFDED